MSVGQESSRPWYAGISRYQWLVLIIASAGWVFDVYEGQIFNLTRGDMLEEILGNGEGVKKYGDMFLAIFLLGGTVGGLLAGSFADRFGRRPVMVATILMYSVFSGVTYFATELWHVAVLRFFVAMGVGGEWAVAASLVAEVFPARARAQASGIFHASSVLGTWAAAVAAILVETHWRYAYLFGIIPALLVLWVRSSVKEPERWQAKRKEATESGGKTRMGSFRELLFERPWGGRAVLGMLLAAVGLGTFWSVTAGGQQLAQEVILAELLGKEAAKEVVALKRTGAELKEKRHQEAWLESSQKGKFLYGIVQTAGGGIGLLSFGPLCAWLGRRRAFLVIQVLAAVFVPIACFVPQGYTHLLVILPVFGFLTLAIHAGYAIYFPELFPTRLRATGTSFCFNGGRILAVPVLLFSGELKEMPTVDIRFAISALGALFLLGAIIVTFLPETKGQELVD